MDKGQYQDFSKRLMEAMKAKGYLASRSPKGICIQTLAQFAGASEQICRRYVRGDALPDYEKITKIAHSLQISPGWLLFGEQSIPTENSLPYIQKIAYLMGIRPYMDRKSFVVGIKRRISYQSLAETLYVEPHQGIVNSGSPSRQQLRRVIKGLEKAGLIEIQSTSKHLILKCLLADADKPNQNNPDTNPTQQLGSIKQELNPAISRNFKEISNKAHKDQIAKPDTPHNSDPFCIYLGKQFEEFWGSYPQQTDKPNAWRAFMKINPDEVLFAKMMQALNEQISSYEQLQKQGAWVPNWKYPANWLAQEGWNHSLTPHTSKEYEHEKNRGTSSKRSVVNNFWGTCSQGAGLSFDDIESAQ